MQNRMAGGTPDVADDSFARSMCREDLDIASKLTFVALGTIDEEHVVILLSSIRYEKR